MPRVTGLSPRAFPSDVRQPLGWPSEQWDPPASPCLASPSPWPQGCHPLCAGECNRPPCRELVSPHPPASPAADTPATCPQPAGGTSGLPPRGSHCFPTPCRGRTPTRAGSPPDAIPTIPFLQDMGSPKTLPALLGRGLACMGYPQLPQASRLGWGQGAARGSRWRWGLGDGGITLSRNHFSFLYLGRALAGRNVPHAVPGTGGW